MVCHLIETIIKNPDEYSFCFDSIMNRSDFIEHDWYETAELMRNTFSTHGQNRNRASYITSSCKNKNFIRRIRNKHVDMVNWKDRIVGLIIASRICAGYTWTLLTDLAEVSLLRQHFANFGPKNLITHSYECFLTRVSYCHR